ncbi:MAG: hypothetical protein ABSG79_27295 [Bryobacteraceae bacterium]|jgi:hypothetical protein
MHHTRYVTMLIATVCLFAVTALAQTTTTVTTDMPTPVVGLAPSEIVQINVINTAAASASGTAASCTGTVTFYTFTGNNSTGTAGTPATFTVGSGELSSFTLKGSGSARISVRGVISLTETERSGVPCSLATNIETYDSTTFVTHLHVETGSPVVAQSAPAPVGH